MAKPTIALISKRTDDKSPFITNLLSFFSRMRPHYRNIKNTISTLFLYHIFLMSMISTFPRTTNGEEPDRWPLLDFKRSLLNDPLKITSSWNDSIHFCNWVGVTCNSTNRRVMGLNLEAQNLTGTIPGSLGNLTYLTKIQLGHNNFHGRIPQEFGRLLQLHHLNLSYNELDGQIPTNLSHCTELVVLTLDANRLKGPIPSQLFTLTKLKKLKCDDNNLNGAIPSWIGNFSSLFYLTLSQNNFQGSIPSEIGSLSRLQFFDVYGNDLTGNVPPSIYNITSLKDLALTQNRLQGFLPQSIGFTLPNLLFFFGGMNNFSGFVPTSFANMSKLRVLDISENSLTGMLPPDLGSLKHLQILNFDTNTLGSGEVGKVGKVGDLSFMNSLANCTSLMDLGLGRNNLGGALPPCFGNLSTQLKRIALGENMISGSIPSGIENLISLQILGMEYNYLNGSIPQNIGKLQNLALLYLNNNELMGTIPSSIGNLSSVTKLFIDHNRLEGSIPPSLGQCRTLQDLDISHNNISGSIPKEVFALSLLSISLTMNDNSLTGPLPSEFGQLVNLAVFDVSQNKLSGNIPSSFDKCISMEGLYLGGNLFEGTIPRSLQALKGLEELNLSSNNLSGSIPEFLGKLSSLKYLDLSYNDFEGRVPIEGIFSNSTMISILGNNNLCGGLQVLHLPQCPSNIKNSPNKRFLVSKVLIPIASTVTIIVILVSIIFVRFRMKKLKKDTLTSSSAKEFLPQISYSELSKSTDGFSVDNLVGSGSFGSVYKGVLSNDGSIVAIKVLNLQQQGASKSFSDECNTLSNIRHRNLLKIITFCSSIDFQGNEFKALVFNFMSKGNLDYWLHSSNLGRHQRRLSLIQRLNIAIDIACGLDYLHNHCETPIIHCDLKPSNILLDDDMVAHVGDFGLARFMLEEPNDQLSFSQTMSLTLKGSIRYIPPEYGSGGRISNEGDIFSFGILLLVMIIGKRPTDDTFGESVNIHSFVETALPQGASSIVDPSIPFEETHQEEENENTIQEMVIMTEEVDKRIMPSWMEECVVSIMRIGLSCSLTTPRERTSMSVVVIELQAIKSSYLKFKKASQRDHK